MVGEREMGGSPTEAKTFVRAHFQRYALSWPAGDAAPEDYDEFAQNNDDDGWTEEGRGEGADI